MEPLMTSAQVADKLRISVRTLWRLVAAGKFPQPIRYSRKLLRWKTNTVIEYMEKL